MTTLPPQFWYLCYAVGGFLIYVIIDAILANRKGPK